MSGSAREQVHDSSGRSGDRIKWGEEKLHAGSAVGGAVRMKATVCRVSTIQVRIASVMSWMRCVTPTFASPTLIWARR